MKTFLMILTAITAGITMISCNELEGLTGTDGESPLIRYLTFRYAEIPSDMTDEVAIALARNDRGNRLRAASVEHWFPTSDSMGLTGGRVSINRVIVTPPGTGHSGGTRLLGGQAFDVHPPQPGAPSSLLIDAIGVSSDGASGSTGEWELQFNEGELTISGSSVQRDFMEFTLDSYNPQNSFATGRFAFIARNRENGNDGRRWIIFDGQFALQR